MPSPKINIEKVNARRITCECAGCGLRWRSKIYDVGETVENILIGASEYELECDECWTYIDGFGNACPSCQESLKHGVNPKKVRK